MKRLSETAGSTNTEARLELVQEHVRAENRHDLEGIMETFGESPRYDDEPWEEHHHGREGVRSYYQELLRGVPDLHIDVEHGHLTAENIILEVVIRGTHDGPWRGLPATGRPIEFPLCAVYSFTEGDELAGERVYYDRATVLRQLGVLHEPDSWLGRLVMPLVHPLTMLKVAWRMLAQTMGGKP